MPATDDLGAQASASPRTRVARFADLFHYHVHLRTTSDPGLKGHCSDIHARMADCASAPWLDRIVDVVGCFPNRDHRSRLQRGLLACRKPLPKPLTSILSPQAGEAESSRPLSMLVLDVYYAVTLRRGVGC